MNARLWTPKKLILASVGVSVLSAAVTAGLLLWVLAPAQPEPAAFHGGPIAAAPVATAPAAAAGLPGDPLARGNALYDRQQWAEAMAAYQQVLAAGSDNADVRTDLGNCYRFTKQPEKALAEYERAQKIAPEHEHSLYNQITLYDEVWHDQERVKTLAAEFERRFPTSENLAAVRKHVR